jgi:predicted acetyltransferase
MGTEIRPYQSDDFEQVTAIRREAFRGASRNADWERGGWVLAEGGRIEAIALVERARQWFGGRVAPCAQVRSVAVVPWARGRGRSRRLLTEILLWLRQDGAAVSTLYPTLLAPYRRVGYEVAGSRTRYRQAIATLPRTGPSDVVPFEASMLSEVQACYRRFAAQTNGLLDRPDYWWDRLLAGSEEQPVYGAVARSGDQIAGYMLYTQERGHGHAMDVPPSPLAVLGLTYALDCRDLVWTDRRSACALLGYVRGNGGLGTDLLWFGPSPEPLSLLADRQDAIAVQTAELWMSRLIDVEAALRARGYPPDLSTAIELEVVDPVLPANARCLRLEWCEGEMTVEQVVRAGTRVDVGALASMYTGRLPAREAARLGLLAGASGREIAALEGAFRGPQPWLPDVF